MTHDRLLEKVTAAMWKKRTAGCLAAAPHAILPIQLGVNSQAESQNTYAMPCEDKNARLNSTRRWSWIAVTNIDCYLRSV
jgi:hypothetical protein